MPIVWYCIKSTQPIFLYARITDLFTLFCPSCIFFFWGNTINIQTRQRLKPSEWSWQKQKSSTAQALCNVLHYNTVQNIMWVLHYGDSTEKYSKNVQLLSLIQNLIFTFIDISCYINYETVIISVHVIAYWFLLIILLSRLFCKLMHWNFISQQ